MFVRLAQKSAGAIDAKVDMLRYQHERGRNFVNEIANSLDGYEKGDSVKTTALIESTAAYISLLRHHIHLEDHVFYPLAEETMSPQEKQSLLEEFEKENKRSGEKTFEECHKLVVDMGTLLVHM
jgi:hemerythrin-like domain-containing protein